ncbi:hypothetical protein Scep_010691 [Stephania cephalantha]|uniref:Rapid ALkalinization Factor n=1 Tax=Stephania cephalantha TaxID=152367 RepID=A0AAP0PHA2_9MAGN
MATISHSKRTLPFTSLPTKPILLFKLVLLLLPVLQFLVISPSTSLDLGMHSKYYCNGSIAECNEEHEMLMESEISHRLLVESHKTISYDVLKGGNAACGGKSCSGAQANKIYPRPCYQYKQCRKHPVGLPQP